MKAKHLLWSLSAVLVLGAGVFLGDDDIRNEIAVTLRIGGEKTGKPVEKDPVSVKPPVNVASLPKAFSQTNEVFQVSFQMVLVPGDRDVENQSIWNKQFPVPARRHLFPAPR